MTAEMGCDQVRDLAPELALGIVEGQERVAALGHLSGCPGCRQLVSDLSSVGDGLLLGAFPGASPRIRVRCPCQARPPATRAKGTAAHASQAVGRYRGRRRRGPRGRGRRRICVLGNNR